MTALRLFVILTSLTTVSALKCYVCNHIYSVPDGIDSGDSSCSDLSWNLTDADTDFIRENLCEECFKRLEWLGPDRYEVSRGCIYQGVLYPRRQLVNTCATTELKAGNYSRCVCDTDLCNADISCDLAHGCYDPPNANCPACTTAGPCSTTRSRSSSTQGSTVNPGSPSSAQQASYSHIGIVITGVLITYLSRK